LENVSFSLPPRGILGIVGESGSGKSVLARALIGSVRPPLRLVAGRVLFRDQDVLRLPAAAVQSLRGREIGYIGADPGNAFDPTLPVGDQLVEKLRSARPGVDLRSAAAEVTRLLEAVRIPSAKRRFHEFPHQYSGGMLQRAMIVDALLSRPAVLIADNIVQPLDVTVAAQIVRLLRDLRDEIDAAIVYIANSLSGVREIAEDVAVLSGGRIVEQDKIGRLISEPRTPYTKQLVDRIPRIWSSPIKVEAISAGSPILSIRAVTKSYALQDRSRFFGRQSVKAVRGVNLDVLQGENLGLIGESGCGKSTLSRLLSWIEEPDSGVIEFEGRSIATMSASERKAMRRRFQLLLQDPYNSLPPHHTMGRAIEEPLRIHGRYSSKQRRELVAAVMSEVGLSVRDFDLSLFGLSAGQLQRVNIARALILQPRLMILDETLSSLDQVEQGRLIDLFEKLQLRHGLTYLFISHDLAMVRRVCSRVAVMYLGKIVELSDNDTIFFRPGHPYTRALLSAVPTVEDRPFKAKDCLLEGEPPSPIDLPEGCSFRMRCPLALSPCREREPDLVQLSSVGASACLIAQEHHGLPLRSTGMAAPV
jgi:peptide/nickel transport system ATP-binding protein